MPHLYSVDGFRMVRKYVSNWHSLLALYLGLLSAVNVRFRDNREVTVTKDEVEIVKKLGRHKKSQDIDTELLKDYNGYLKFHEEIYRRYLESKGFSYTNTNDGIKVSTHTGTQLIIPYHYSYILDEIFLMKVYGSPDLRGRTVIDVGASIADTSLYFAGLGADKTYGFESDNSRYQIALKNIKLNNMQNRILIFNQPATSSSLGEVISNNELKEVFLKLDCEGCEYEILSNSDKSLFDQILDIVLEIHGPSEPIAQKLKSLGFHPSYKKLMYASKQQRTS